MGAKKEESTLIVSFHNTAKHTLLILSATLFQKFYNEKKLMNELKTKEKKIVLGPR
jgi:hypothetical protein